MDILHNALDTLHTVLRCHPTNLQTVAIIIIGVVAYRGVRKQIREHDLVAQRQTTLSTIINHEFHNPDWHKCKKIAKKVLREHGNRTFNPTDTLAGTENHNPKDRDRLEQTLIFLNYYELIAIGILEDAIHEDTYKTWFKTGYIQTWELSEPFVSIWRKRKDRDRSQTYKKFQAVAKLWSCDQQVRRTRYLSRLRIRQ